MGLRERYHRLREKALSAGSSYHWIEEAALLGAILHREAEKMTGLEKLLWLADIQFQRLSEKLKFLELETGTRWYPKKFYRARDQSKKSCKAW
ncbi:MAG: hypothetical protein HY538_04275 [Deltaproteobacteria bacterium]|nr:hypothetical protein [Deltaproteobacteria bacterium]